MIETDKVHILTIMLRKKDNPNMNLKREKFIYREVYTKGDFRLRNEKINKLKAIQKNIGEGIWRLYETVNFRNVESAKNLLMHKLIDGEIKLNKVDSEWKSILQKIKCRGERKFLLDLDDCNRDDFDNVIIHLCSGGIHIHQCYKTLNGWHIITEKFDTRNLKTKFPFIDIKYDDMKLLEVIK